MASKKVAVVTGANKGIGLAIVRRLCKEFNGDTVLTSRDETLGREAIRTLEHEGLRPMYHQLDITSQESIDQLKSFLLAQYGGLDILVNNAAICYKLATTAPFLEQAKTTVATNFTGTLNVSRILFPILRSHSRVVSLSSTVTGAFNRVGQNLQDKFKNPSITENGLVSLMNEFIMHVEKGDYKEVGWTNTALGTTKMAVTVLTRIQAQEMASLSDKKDIIVNCCCPGFTKTDMSEHKGHLTPDEAAVTPVHCALLPPGSLSGKLWKDKSILEW